MKKRENKREKSEKVKRAKEGERKKQTRVR